MTVRVTTILLLQTTGAIAAIAVPSLMPPANGAMLLIGDDAGRLAARARAVDADIVGRGPWSRSLIVRGDRARLAGPWNDGVFAVATPAAWCGGSRA